MNFIKKLSNLLFGTRFNTDNFVMPCKKELMKNSLREYGAKDYW